MSIPYNQASMASVRAVEGTHISYPFIADGDTSTAVYNMICTQRGSDYDSAEIELNDNMSSAVSAGVVELPFPADSTAFYVGDSNFASIAGGMISFTRTFCNIPQSTTKASGSAFVTFPGNRGAYAQAAYITLSNISMTSGTRGVTLTTSEAHGLSIGDQRNLFMDYTVGADPFIHSVAGAFAVLAVPSATTFIIDIGQYWGSQVTLALLSGRFSVTVGLRAPKSRNVSTITRYDYILPGITPGIASVLDVSLPPAFEVQNVSMPPASGQTLGFQDNMVSLGTIPSANEYVEMVQNEHNIIIESSLAEWAGNILVMKTKTCKAK